MSSILLVRALELQLKSVRAAKIKSLPFKLQFRKGYKQIQKNEKYEKKVFLFKKGNLVSRFMKNTLNNNFAVT
jgi:hypothetical protein